MIQRCALLPEYLNLGLLFVSDYYRYMRNDMVHDIMIEFAKMTGLSRGGGPAEALSMD